MCLVSQTIPVTIPVTPLTQVWSIYKGYHYQLNEKDLEMQNSVKVETQISPLKSCIGYDVSLINLKLEFLSSFQAIQINSNFLIIERIISTTISRSSHPEVFCEKGVLINFTKLTGKHLCQRIKYNSSMEIETVPFKTKLNLTLS